MSKKKEKPKEKPKGLKQPFILLFAKKKEQENPIWLSISEICKIVGVQEKTIRRAIKTDSVKFKIVKDRYQVDLKSVIIYMHSNIKLKNKFYQIGIGQYIKELED